MTRGTVDVLDGSTFAVSDRRGDITPDQAQANGFFYRDTRHLSQWEVRLNGRPVRTAGCEVLEYDETVFVLVEQTGTVYRDAQLGLTRTRRVDGRLHEQLVLANTGPEPATVCLSMLFDADFADIFDVKDGRRRHGGQRTRIDGDTVELSYRRDEFVRRTSIHAPGWRIAPGLLEFTATLPPGGTARLGLEVTPAAGSRSGRSESRSRPGGERPLAEWTADAPRLETDSDLIRRVYRRSLVDLAALRFYPDLDGVGSVPAAGLPWYMALFGRDSLITSYQTLPYLPELAAGTLRVLAARQAIRHDDFRDADPGKILHELRHGESAWFREHPQSPYYGSADATPLFLIVLDEYHRWTGDDQLVRELEPAARAALHWIEHEGDTNGDGYLDYLPRNPNSGIVNQCWKDSPNSIVFPDGTLAELPRAPCELQGYGYDARRRAARLARECWGDPALAERLDRDATDLRARFHRDYWLDEPGWFALALDGRGRPVPTLASNLGHLLWTGIVAGERVPQVAEQLMSDRLYSGWGIRTLASGQPAFNPFGYHTGSVWPHDNAIAAAGLARYGCRVEAARIAGDLFEAAQHLGHRLPEALTGLDRATTRDRPVPYPGAASPQAWASGTPLLLLTTLLGLAPGTERAAASLSLNGQQRAITLDRSPRFDRLGNRKEKVT